MKSRCLHGAFKDPCHLEPSCTLHVQMLEALTQETAINVKQVAAWCLAAAAASARASSRGFQTSNTGGEQRDCVGLVMRTGTYVYSHASAMLLWMSGQTIVYPLPVSGTVTAGSVNPGALQACSQLYQHSLLPAGGIQTLSSDQAALAALPAESAMKALIEHLTASSAASGITSCHSSLPSPRCCCAAALCLHVAVKVQRKKSSPCS